MYIYPINSDMKDDAAITNLFSQFTILNPAISDSGTHRNKLFSSYVTSWNIHSKNVKKNISDENQFNYVGSGSIIVKERWD